MSQPIEKMLLQQPSTQRYENGVECVESKTNKEGQKTFLLNEIPNIEQYIDPNQYLLTTGINEPLQLISGGGTPVHSSIFDFVIDTFLEFFPKPNLTDKERDEFIASLLTTYHANPNYTETRTFYAAKVTPLMSALRARSREVIEVLVKHGANCFVRDNNGYTVLDWAILLNPPMSGLCDKDYNLDNDYRTLFAIKAPDANTDLEPLSDGTLVLYNPTKAKQIQPVMAEWAEKLYKSYIEPLAHLNDFFSTLGGKTEGGAWKSVTEVIASYNTIPLSEISLVLEKNPALFLEIKNKLLQLLKTSHHVCKGSAATDNTPGSVNKVLCFMFQNYQPIIQQQNANPAIDAKMESEKLNIQRQQS